MAHRALKSVRGGMPGGRDAMRMMQRMGMKVDEVPGVVEVVIKTLDKQLVLSSPSVAAIKIQGQTMYQITGGTLKEQPTVATTTIEPVVETSVPISDEDIQLVSEQTGTTPEAAKKALEAARGNLAKAILGLKGTG